jgi:hypothetical protein
MQSLNLRKKWVISLSVIAYFLLLPTIAQARDMKTTVYEIILDSDNYDGKTVVVEGIAKSIKQEVSQSGKSNTIFLLTQKPETTSSLQVLTWKELAIKEGDYVRVVGKYHKMVELPCRWNNRINASTVKKVEPPICSEP